MLRVVLMLCLLCVIFKVGVTCVGNDYLKNHTIKQCVGNDYLKNHTIKQMMRQG